MIQCFCCRLVLVKLKMSLRSVYPLRRYKPSLLTMMNEHNMMFYETLL